MRAVAPSGGVAHLSGRGMAVWASMMHCLAASMKHCLFTGCVPDLPLASAGSDMIGWSRVLLSHTLDAARSY